MKRPRGVKELAVADLSESVTTRWRGSVDGWGLDTGIHGWALTADAPLDRLKLELVVDDYPFDTVETGEPRSDIDGILGVRVLPGFHFSQAVFGRLARLHSRRRDLVVRVRVAGTLVYLPGPHQAPTVGELVDAWRQTILEPLTAERAELDKGDRLLARLANLRAAADPLRDQPLKPSSEHVAGQIEAFHVGAGGRLWFLGWMLRGAAPEFSTVLVERQKYPGGAATLQYERQDLASPWVAVVGLLDTGWTPPAVQKEFYVYLGPDARRHLRVSPEAQLIGQEAFLAAYRQALTSAVSGHGDVLGAILTSGNTWIPGNAAAAGIAADASLDRLLMVPGFGCIAEGWAVSPVKAVRTFEMKVGDCLMVADEASTYFKPRPDLANIFGGNGGIEARGGFVAILRGDLPATATGAPLLRVIFTDGTSSVHRLEPKILHRLHCIADSSVVLRLYPSLRQEPSYGALLGALRRGLTHTTTRPRAIASAPAERLLVLRLPREPSNQRLCFDCIARLGDSAELRTGICFVTDDGEGLAGAKLLFQELQSATPLPLSLYCIADPAGGFAALPLLLVELRADRFVYVDRGALLTARGWRAALKFLGRGGSALTYFEFIDDTGAPDRIHGAVSAACFGWTTTALFAWLPTAPKLLQGVRATNGLPEPMARDGVLSGAAMRVEPTVSSRLADMLDDDLLQMRSSAVL